MKYFILTHTDENDPGIYTHDNLEDALKEYKWLLDVGAGPILVKQVEVEQKLVVKDEDKNDDD